MEIDREHYNSLLITEEKLQQLEINGVDNWAHYGCMCYETNSEECIFCTEDEYKFLNLKDKNE